jgi:hypothetical protein
VKNKSFKIIQIEKEIIPKKAKILVAHHGRLFPEYVKLKKCSDKYKIKSYKVSVNETTNQIESISLLEKHPNCNPETRQFCLGDLKGIEFNEKGKILVEEVLSTWNLMNCYFAPSRWIDYEY